eukprot:TRINITY_DN28471_c0_g1_i2.p1 TRINITY_DN28471_c0_g1~~TRINITY_DN28471_c0_g1_i2.p1  ORF type:complete len:473 (+),score=103.47 TRINITY_DN28471_c0_g1_i2:40-1458(+)
MCRLWPAFLGALGLAADFCRLAHAVRDTELVAQLSSKAQNDDAANSSSLQELRREVRRARESSLAAAGLKVGVDSRQEVDHSKVENSSHLSGSLSFLDRIHRAVPGSLGGQVRDKLLHTIDVAGTQVPVWSIAAAVSVVLLGLGVVVCSLSGESKPAAKPKAANESAGKSKADSAGSEAADRGVPPAAAGPAAGGLGLGPTASTGAAVAATGPMAMPAAPGPAFGGAASTADGTWQHQPGSGVPSNPGPGGPAFGGAVSTADSTWQQMPRHDPMAMPSPGGLSAGHGGAVSTADGSWQQIQHPGSSGVQAARDPMAMPAPLASSFEGSTSHTVATASAPVSAAPGGFMPTAAAAAAPMTHGAPGALAHGAGAAGVDAGLEESVRRAQELQAFLAKATEDIARLEAEIQGLQQQQQPIQLEIAPLEDRLGRIGGEVAAKFQEISRLEAEQNAMETKYLQTVDADATLVHVQGR